ncbi:MAG: hypothetical protein JW769_00750 [Parachlamydiales bacterium]|nr:hypothetical protein [Parachlamydiales bacterium]
MKDLCKIYIDRLKEDKTEILRQDVSSDFLAIQEKELRFTPTVFVHIEALIQDDLLILQLNAQATAIMPCAVCNTMTEHPLTVKNILITVPLEKITNSIYDCSEDLREALLLEIPITTECNRNCSERNNLKKFLNKEKLHHYPFKNLFMKKEN